MKVFITGMPGVGKTRLIKEFLKSCNKKITGIITESIIEKGKRTGFTVTDICTGKTAILASVHQQFGPQISKYRVNVENFEEIALPSLERQAELYIIDEIGRMELLSQKFEQKVLDIVSSNANVIATVHRDYKTKYQNYGDVWILTEKNWEKTLEKLIKLFQ